MKIFVNANDLTLKRAYDKYTAGELKEIWRHIILFYLRNWSWINLIGSFLIVGWLLYINQNKYC
jgi:hypothetical protein